MCSRVPASLQGHSPPGACGRPTRSATCCGSISIKDLVTLPGDAIAIRGSAATGLISTPNAFYLHSGPGKYGGEFVAVMKSDFSGLLFSSYLPGYDSCRIAATRGGIAIVGAGRKDDGREKPTPPPIVNAVQPRLAGGEFDGHIIVIDMP